MHANKRADALLAETMERGTQIAFLLKENTLLAQQKLLQTPAPVATPAVVRRSSLSIPSSRARGRSPGPEARRLTFAAASPAGNAASAKDQKPWMNVADYFAHASPERNNR